MRGAGGFAQVGFGYTTYSGIIVKLKTEHIFLICFSDVSVACYYCGL